MLRGLRQAAVDWRLNDPSPNGAPYLDAAGLGLALVAAIILCWPMLVAGGPLFYADTYAYAAQGNSALDIVTDRLAAIFGNAPSIDGPGSPNAAGNDSPDGGMGPVKLRSLGYAVYLALLSRTGLGFVLTCIVQGAAMLWMFLALVPQFDTTRLRRAVLGFALVAAFTTLPWFVSYAMPDLLAAMIPVFYMVLLGREQALARWQLIALVCLATGAVLAHYGHLPLAAALALLVIAWRWFERSLRPMTVLLCLAPVILGIAGNYSAGKAAVGEDSIAPARLPILLARSIEDGPARWYLEEACPAADYAICDLFEEIPDNIHDFLWVEEGYAGASDAQVQAIRAEENTILLAAFRRYPVEQTRALFGNAALQTVTVGTGELWTLPPGSEPLDPEVLQGGSLVTDDPALRPFDILLPLATAAALLALGVAWWRGLLDRSQVLATMLLLAALVVNAAIFGGLSAPVDRYQSRLVWLMPALLVVFSLRWPSERHADADASITTSAG